MITINMAHRPGAPSQTQTQSQTQQPRFKSEVFVPIHKDSQSFEQRQKTIWEDMHERMERRRREWDGEVERMRKDFFRLKPNEKRRGSSENLLDTMDVNDVFYGGSTGGDKTFRVDFDVREFEPHEISVRTQDQKLLVHAKHEEHSEGRNVCREFSRQVDIPRHVDPQKLSCTLSNDHILQVEAPVSAPAYEKIRENHNTAGFLGSRPFGSPSPSSSSSSSPFSTPLTIIQNHHQPPAHHNSTMSSPQPGHLTSGPAMTEQDGTRTFKITVEVGHEYEPQDVLVKTVDRKLVINARHEEKTAGRSSCKEFSREFDLPEEVDPNLVTASMTEDGKLLIEAPIAHSTYSHGAYAGKPGSTKQPKMTISMGN